MPHTRHRAAFAFVFMLALASCGGGKKLQFGASCKLNSDCAEPLVCKLGSCHRQCAQTRDCLAGERCVKLEAAGVCLAPEEGKCAGACAAGLSCGADNLCRSSCTDTPECLAGQRCSARVCSDDPTVVSVPDGGGLVPPDGGAGDTGSQDGGSATDAPRPADTGQGGSLDGPLTSLDAGVAARPLAGKCATQFPEGWLTADRKQLFVYCEGKKLGTLPLDGGPLLELATVGAVGAPAVATLDGSYLVYVEANHLISVPATGGPAKTLAIDLSYTPPRRVGDRVVFLAGNPSSAAGTLYSVPAAGGEPTTLAAMTGGFRATPDGSRVLFFGTPSYAVKSIPTAGGSAADLGAVLSSGSTNVLDSMAWSPDGKKVAFLELAAPATYPMGTYPLAIMAADGTGKVIGGSFQTSGSGGISAMAFVPDGSQVLVAWRNIQAPGTTYLDTVPVTGGAQAKLAQATTLGVVGTAGKAGNLVVYYAQNGASSPELMVVPWAGGTPTKLSTLEKCGGPARQIALVALSPDRASAVYPDAFGDLILADLDRGTTSKLVPGAKPLGQACFNNVPGWSPDGSAIVYERCAPGASSCQTFVVTRDGVPLASLGTGVGQWVFSPDSKRVVARDIVTLRAFTLADPSRFFEQRNTGFALACAAGITSPAGCPWVDADRFVIEGGTSGLAVVDMRR